MRGVAVRYCPLPTPKLPRKKTAYAGLHLIVIIESCNAGRRVEGRGRFGVYKNPNFHTFGAGLADTKRKIGGNTDERSQELARKPADEGRKPRGELQEVGNRLPRYGAPG